MTTTPQKRTGRRPASSPGRTENAVSRKEAGEFVERYDEGTQRAGMVPDGGRPDDVDPRRRLYLGKQRLGKRWSEIIIAVEEGVFTWDEFVATLDDSEIARGQLKDKDGKFRGRPPSLVPRGFFDACTKVLMKRARSEWEKAYLGSVEAMAQIALGKQPGAKVSDVIKASQFVIERMEGKTPEKVEVKISDPFGDMVAGAIAEVSEDAAIANAHEYLERMGSNVEGENDG